MSIIRLIHIKVDPSQIAEAERIWKQDCAPLMIRQPGCTSEQLLKCTDVEGEYISYSEWESQEDIDRYRDSDDHKTIQSHSRGLQGARAEVKRYETVG
ncbi:MAG: antibiotic biosynthesis monooxygenase family protein [Alphaproteobacteria bacterium]|nr:antibiotic biosynthesis monooxygenase family protein [Alphaproteobacteria bacterium]